MTQETLEALMEEIGACRICRDDPDGTALAHEPRPVVVASARAPIVICGQAPGTRVHKSGKPFDDRSGDRLREWLGVSRAEFYDPAKFAIVPMGFCFPGLDAKGGDLPPRKECARNWHSRLFAALPEFALMLAIGQYAHAYHLKTLRRNSLTGTVRDWREIYEQCQARPILPLPHPSWRNTAWLRKNSWFEIELVPFLQNRVRELLDRA